MKYTKYVLDAEVIRRLRENFNILNVSDKDAILGAEGELKEELAQLSLGELTGVAESFAEEEQSKQLEDDLEQIAMKEERIQKKTEEIMREYDLS